MATGSSNFSIVRVTGNVQALSNAIVVAIMSEQATPVSSPSTGNTNARTTARSARIMQNNIARP